MGTRALLVGTKEWAQNHARAYALCRHAELAGVVGHTDESRLNDVADAYSIPRRFMSVKDALADVQPDMVDIAAGPRYRLEGVLDCLGSSVKLVNIEKPMALVPSEAYEIERVCRENGLLLTVNHQKKFNAPWAKARAMVADGALGDVRFFRATCRGNVLEQGTHIADMLLFLADYKPIKWVMGQVADLEGFDKEKVPAPDSASAVMEFEDGVQAMLTMGNVGWEVPGETNKWFHFAVEAYGTEGDLAISLNHSLRVRNYATGTCHVEPSIWGDTFIQGLADHLDAAALYAADPSAGHVSCLENSMMSFQAVMAVYASACGGDRIDVTERFDDGIVESLRARREGR